MNYWNEGWKKWFDIGEISKTKPKRTDFVLKWLFVDFLEFFRKQIITWSFTNTRNEFFSFVSLRVYHSLLQVFDLFFVFDWWWGIFLRIKIYINEWLQVYCLSTHILLPLPLSIMLSREHYALHYMSR